MIPLLVEDSSTRVPYQELREVELKVAMQAYQSRRLHLSVTQCFFTIVMSFDGDDELVKIILLLSFLF